MSLRTRGSCDRQEWVPEPGNQLAFLHFQYPRLKANDCLCMGFQLNGWNKVCGYILTLRSTIEQTSINTPHLSYNVSYQRLLTSRNVAIHRFGSYIDSVINDPIASMESETLIHFPLKCLGVWYHLITIAGRLYDINKYRIQRINTISYSDETCDLHSNMWLNEFPSNLIVKSVECGVVGCWAEVRFNPGIPLVAFSLRSGSATVLPRGPSSVNTHWLHSGYSRAQHRQTVGLAWLKSSRGNYRIRVTAVINVCVTNTTKSRQKVIFPIRKH